MNCTRVEPLVDDFVDDELKPELRAEVERHLADCPACRCSVEELRELQRSVAALPDGIAPPRDLLPGIRDAVRRGTGSGTYSPWWRWAGVAASVLLLCGAVWLGLRLTRPDHESGPTTTKVGTALPAAQITLAELGAAELEYEQATVRLLEAIEQRDDLSAETKAVISENLKVIDQAIEEVRAALDADPGDTRNGHVLNALYRQKVEFLWRISRLSS